MLQRAGVTLDEAGRPLRVCLDGCLYRRGLDGRVLELIRRGDDADHYHDVRLLSAGESRRWLQRVAALVGESEGWVERLEEDGRQFAELYSGLAVLPPDQYRSLILQLTRGCAYNRCGFCTFYRGREFAVRGPQDFARHLEQVVAQLGPGLSSRRGVFLGDASAGGVSTARLGEALEILRTFFPCVLRDDRGRPRHRQGFDEVSAFLDVFLGASRPLREWAELAQMGLHGLYLGIESGSPRVLEFLGKPVDLERAAFEVGQLRAAGLRVGLIFLLGAGGVELEREHREATARWVKGLELGREDRIYLSPLVPPGAVDCRAQARQLRGAWGFPAPPRGPSISLYDIRQFVY